MAALELRGIHKSFGALHVLKGVDLTVEPGSLVFIIGPSGSGKSTLLRCCNLLEVPDRGAVVVQGGDITRAGVDLNAVRQRVGMVFQAFNLYPHMTALGNVTLALRQVQKLAREEADSRGRAALARVGLAEKSDSLPGQLSGISQTRHAPPSTTSVPRRPRGPIKEPIPPQSKADHAILGADRFAAR